MVNQTIIEKLEQGTHYLIEGNNIAELVEYSLQKVRPKSQGFYKKELTKDLQSVGYSHIDFHAGNKNWYKVELSKWA